MVEVLHVVLFDVYVGIILRAMQRDSMAKCVDEQKFGIQRLHLILRRDFPVVVEVIDISLHMMRWAI